MRTVVTWRVRANDPIMGGEVRIELTWAWDIVPLAVGNGRGILHDVTFLARTMTRPGWKTCKRVVGWNIVGPLIVWKNAKRGGLCSLIRVPSAQHPTQPCQLRRVLSSATKKGAATMLKQSPPTADIFVKGHYFSKERETRRTPRVEGSGMNIRLKKKKNFTKRWATTFLDQIYELKFDFKAFCVLTSAVPCRLCEYVLMLITGHSKYQVINEALDALSLQTSKSPSDVLFSINLPCFKTRTCFLLILFHYQN